MYSGRFAPSPTGALHLGSLVSALASFLDARLHGGCWYVRIEDLDQAREVSGAAREILHALNVYGLHWDGEVVYQSQRLAAYTQALEQLKADGWVYPCFCSRKQIAAQARLGVNGYIYPETCRDAPAPMQGVHAIRVRTPDADVGFEDRACGWVAQNLAKESGDFVIRRADGYFAYQLAVVVDDAWQGITHVVRGMDLLHNTPWQIHLQHLLGYNTPIYLHHALVLGDDAQKLSKQHHALPVNTKDPRIDLYRALLFLGYALPEEARLMHPEALLSLVLQQGKP